VEKTPDAVALIVGEERWSYRELNAWADRLGLCARRDAAMVAGLLAILKAGGAYVPLDPAYPQARLEAIAADAGVGPLRRGEGGRPAGPVRDTAAYLIYTSGSTAVAPPGTARERAEGGRAAREPGSFPFLPTV
jgi:non-ribosomal peptide synthetase component F